MGLDEKRLVESVDFIIRETSRGRGTYPHNLRFNFDTYDDMMQTGRCLSRHYALRFKISTEVCFPANVDPAANPDEFNKRAEYSVLMGSRNLGGPFD